MHLLLPPSESKAPGGRGQSLRRHLAGRVDPGPLVGARTEVIAALHGLVTGDPDVAARALALPAGVAAEALRADAQVLDSPTMPALRRYTGVVYDALHYPQMSAEQQRTARRSVLIFSGLLGVVAGGEAVPNYRVPASATLPGLGTLTSFWRGVLSTEFMPLVGHRGLIVDLRSSDYTAMWRPRSVGEQRRVLSVRILSPLPRGGDGVISFVSKRGKGLLAAELIRRTSEQGRGAVVGAADVIDAWRACVGRTGEAHDGGVDLFTA